MNLLALGNGLTAGEALLMGAKVAAIGIVTVFVVLLILILVISLLKNLFGQKSKAPEVKKAPVQREVVVNEENDDEVVAAITACIRMILAEENQSTKVLPEFRINKIREIIRN